MDNLLASKQASKQASKNYNSIDLLKFVFSFAVVAIHTEPLNNCSIVWANKIYETVVRMAVPFFFIAAGFFLGNKMQLDNTLHSEENIGVLKKYISKIGKMYLIWTIVYLPLAIIHFFHEKTPFFEAILKYFIGFVCIGEQYNSWVLWYLLSTIYATVIILFILKKGGAVKQILLLSLLASVAVAVFDYIGNYEGDLQGILGYARKGISYIFSKGRIFNGMIYIPIGMVLSKKDLKAFLCWIFLLIGSLGRFFIENRIVTSYLLVLSSIGFFEIIKTVRLPEKKTFPVLRNMSTTIYFIHLYIWTVYYVLVYGKKTYGLDSFIVASVVSFIMAFVYWFITKKKEPSLQS